jgi:hypothetical protein
MQQLPITGVTERDRDIAIRQLIEGRGNYVGTVTLTANATTTTISKSTINENAVFIPFAQTANAAAALATTYAAVTKGTVTITHANNAQTDRSFFYAVVGG